MLSEQQVKEFDRNGCLIGGKVISDDEVQELRDELDRVIAKGQSGFAEGEARPVLISNLSGKADAPVWQIVNIWEASPAFERLLYTKPVIEAISQLTHQPDIQIWPDQIQFKPPTHGGVNNWHQDAPYWPVLAPETPVTAWIALDEVDESNGCMWMVPGSHKWGNHIKFLESHPTETYPHLKDFTPPANAEINQVKAIPWPVRKGEVSFHHSMTWHGSGKNVSDRPRRAIALHFMTGEARFVANGQHVMKKFITLKDGEPMSMAGNHFPQLARGGKAMPMPERLKATTAR
jgi:ectoine hydroxylase-related dioxygenase (phytanoyl-CoA dioxygenase family)